MSRNQPPPVDADRDRAAQLDREDPLRHFLTRFTAIPAHLVYLDGNSLGRQPLDSKQRIDEVVEHQWGQRLIRGWNDGWMRLPHTIGDRLGRHLLGAGPGQTLLADSTTVCFYKLATAALLARPGRDQIITDTDNFPTDRYVLEGLADRFNMTIRWIQSDPRTGPTPDQVAEQVTDRTALVSFSHVSYRSAHIADLRKITRITHDAGALVLWDLSHSAGIVELDLDGDDVDLAVGCTYKYLNGGPGSPAFLYVNRKHQATLRQPVWGWLGRRDPFLMEPCYLPADGVAQMLSGTPSVLGLTAAQGGIELSIEAGIDRIRAKSTKLTEYAIALADTYLLPHQVTIGSPRPADLRGGHLALIHPDAERLTAALAEHDVIADFRAPDVIRYGLSPLTTTYSDVLEGTLRLAAILETEHDGHDGEKNPGHGRFRHG